MSAQKLDMNNGLSNTPVWPLQMISRGVCETQLGPEYVNRYSFLVHVHEFRRKRISKNKTATSTNHEKNESSKSNKAAAAPNTVNGMAFGEKLLVRLADRGQNGKIKILKNHKNICRLDDVICGHRAPTAACINTANCQYRVHWIWLQHREFRCICGHWEQWVRTTNRYPNAILCAIQITNGAQVSALRIIDPLQCIAHWTGWDGAASVYAQKQNNLIARKKKYANGNHIRI